MEATEKAIIIIAGSSGAGKTTFSNHCLPGTSTVLPSSTPKLFRVRRVAPEDEGQGMIVPDGKMSWETDSKRLFPSGLEAEMCKRGRVTADDILD